MRFLVISRPSAPIPAEQVGPLLAGVQGMARATPCGHWRGSGSLRAETAAAASPTCRMSRALYVMMSSYPFGSTSHIEVRALVDGDWAIGVLEEVLRAAAGG